MKKRVGWQCRKCKDLMRKLGGFQSFCNCTSEMNYVDIDEIYDRGIDDPWDVWGPQRFRYSKKHWLPVYVDVKKNG